MASTFTNKERSMKIVSVISLILITFSFNSFALDVKQRFNHLDKDKDGYLSPDELTPQPHLKKRISQWDTDNDKRISLLEFKNYLTSKS